jgi:hypothetical protein
MSARGPLDFEDDPRESAKRGLSADDVRRTRGVGGGDPPAKPPPPARPPGASRYTWFIGLAAFLLLVLVTVNSVSTGGVESGGPDTGDELLPFAVPLADAPPREREDANLDEDDACGVRGEGILNICEHWEKGPVVLALFPTDAGRCSGVMDQMARVRPRFPDVAFVAVGSEGDRDKLKGRAPLVVGWDKDKGLASIYGLVGCPQVTFAKRGGKVTDTVFKPIDDAEFIRQVRAIR